MSDISENSNDKGFRINARGISCIPCRCKRQFYYKETTTVKDNEKITTNTVVDKRNTKFGSTGRNTSPDDIFKPDNNLQAGSIEICHTGWGKSQITPEELEERVDKLETDITLMKKDIEIMGNNKIKMD